MTSQFRDSATATLLTETEILDREWEQCRLSATGEVVPLVETIAAEMAAVGYPEHDVFSMRLALEEAIVNGLQHGNKLDPAKYVHVRYHISEEQVLAEIEDQGKGFDPEDVPDPTALENVEKVTGRGVLLILHYTTWARYSRRGNRVTLCKCPSAPLASDSP
jgi:serine/threonine-protein kinase RsbW